MPPFRRPAFVCSSCAEAARRRQRHLHANAEGLPSCPRAPACRPFLLAAVSSALPDSLVQQLEGLTGALSDTLAIQEPTLQALWNTLFWVALGLGCVLALHAVVRGVIIWRRRRMPMFLEVSVPQPRSPQPWLRSEGASACVQAAPLA